MAYDATNGKYVNPGFGQVISVADTTKGPNPNADTIVANPTSKSFELFNFVGGMTTSQPWLGLTINGTGDAAKKDAIEKVVDNSVLGNMMDCGECHVGGGAMEYIPKYLADGEIGSPMGPLANPANRVPLRGFTSTIANAVTWFIDVFGPKGDGKDATYEAYQNNYAQSGVLEVDCLVCHLKDYNWNARRDAVRVRAFDASRAVGAGFASYSTSFTPRTTVVYDPAKLAFINGSTASNGVKLASAVAQKIQAVPDAGNCASCHFATLETEKFQVEWKKRGEFWGGSEVHTGIGCMGCHQRKDMPLNGAIDLATVGTSGIANTGAPNKKLSMCDPAKGGDCAFDAQWNAVDKVVFKNCNDCHLDKDADVYDVTGAKIPADQVEDYVPTWNTYGAPDSNLAHKAFGLTDKIAYKADGTAASHLEVIDCSACHMRKLDATVAQYYPDGAFRNYTTFPITGGAMVDGTGVDEQGRLAVHDEVYVERDMKDDIALYWGKDGNGKNGKIFAANLLSSFFIRDMNGLFDANNDGRGPGLDPYLPTHVAKLNKTADLHAVTHNGSVDGTELDNMFTNITNNVKPLLGSTSTETTVPKLSIMGVTFKATHNIAPANKAWGAAGCKECHSTGSKFMSSSIDISPKTDPFGWTAGQFVNLTKVNGLVEPSDLNPTIVDKNGVRSVAVNYANNSNTKLSTGFRDVAKAELLYEGTFKTRDTTWYDSITGATREPYNGAGAAAPWYDQTGLTTTVPGTTVTAGWTLKIETKADGAADSTLVPRTFSVTNGKLTNVGALITHMGTFASAYEFDITNVSEKIKITAKSGKVIRLSTQSDVGPFGLAGKLWKDTPIVRNNKYTGNVNESMSGRSAYMSYFNRIGEAPTASMTINGAACNGAGTVASPCTAGTGNVVFAATAPVNHSFTWTFSDSVDAKATTASTTRNITTAKIFTANLQVKNDATGDIVMVKKVVSVATAAPGITVGAITTTAGLTTVPLSALPTHDTIYVKWADGLEQKIAHTGATASLTHRYYSAGPFQATIFLKNTGVLVGKQTTVSITP